ncbi:hypothetical protein MMB232_00652 [Brevundimonas subvibrioides]
MDGFRLRACSIQRRMWAVQSSDGETAQNGIEGRERPGLHSVDARIRQAGDELGDRCAESPHRLSQRGRRYGRRAQDQTVALLLQRALVDQSGEFAPRRLVRHSEGLGHAHGVHRTSQIVGKRAGFRDVGCGRACRFDVRAQHPRHEKSREEIVVDPGARGSDEAQSQPLVEPGRTGRIGALWHDLAVQLFGRSKGGRRRPPAAGLAITARPRKLKLAMTASSRIVRPACARLPRVPLSPARHDSGPRACVPAWCNACAPA